MAPLKPFIPSPAQRQAMVALARGRASAGQQKVALKCILEDICEAHKSPFVIGAPDTLQWFSTGTHWVGQEIVRIAGGVMISFPTVQEIEIPDGPEGEDDTA